MLINIACLNINGTNVTGNNSTNNTVLLFLVSDLKIVYYNIHWSQCLVQEIKNILPHYLFGDEIIQNCTINLIIFLLRPENEKMIEFPGSRYNNN